MTLICDQAVASLELPGEDFLHALQGERDEACQLPPGRYFIAPDSADPLPESMWKRLDLEALGVTVDRINRRDEPTEDGRTLLIRAGGAAMTDLLKDLGC